ADRGSLAERLSEAATHELVTNVLAIASFSLLLANADPWLVIVGGTVTYLACVVPHLDQMKRASLQVRPTGTFTLSRVVLVIVTGSLSDASWAATALLAALIASEVTTARIARGAIPYAQRMPGLAVRNHGYFSAAWLFYINSFAL